MTMVHVEPMVISAPTEYSNGRKTTTTVPTKMKILSVLPSSDSREETTTTEAVLRQARDDDEHDFVLVSTSMGDHDSPTTTRHRLDKFGFIANMDRHGNLVDDFTHDIAPTPEEARTTERRTEKWNVMMTKLPPAAVCLKGGRRRKLLLRRLRKGVPEKLRAQVWQWLANVPAKVAKHRGLYQRLVEEASETRPPTPPEAQTKHSKSFKVIQDTIERDIHRTFPRHYMFYQEEIIQGQQQVVEAKNQQPAMVRTSTDKVLASNHMGCLAESTREIAAMITELDFMATDEKKTAPVHPDYVPPRQILEARGGQASLRRVLKAYSVYDRDIGYCQGMNFIAGMFLTLMPEEEAFWMLVAVMKDQPCRMRGLFGEGMRETHKVLHVAEKLIHQYLPRLGKHMDAEHIHVTMFATQWLLTQYTSSFQFDLVVRVWDCILAEGWKMTYRVMLAMLKQYESRLLKLSFEDILNFFRELPDQVHGDEIIETAMRIPLRRRQIAKWEKDWEVRGSGSAH